MYPSTNRHTLIRSSNNVYALLLYRMIKSENMFHYVL